MITDLFSIAYRNLKRRKLRTFLTLLGIVIGVSAVVALISVGQGMQMSINDMFEGVGADILIITPGGGMQTGVTPVSSDLSASKLYKHDVDVVNSVSGIEYAFGLISDIAKVEFRGQVRYVMIFGVPTDKKAKEMSEGINLFRIEQGRNLNEGDRYKALAASAVASDFFDKEIEIGDKILINDVEFRVVGIREKSGSPIHDRVISIPSDTARELFDKPEEVSTIFARVKEGFSPSEVAEKVEKALRNERGVKEGEEDFTVESAEQLISGLNTILAAVQAVLIGIAAISLLVGGVGIMNTMYTSVMEQTSNIGLMKAIGARNRDVMLLFLLEAGLVGLIGGILGISIGIALGKIVETAAVGFGIDIFKAAVTPELVIGALLFSFLIGTISGLFPARRAAKMNPVDALRYR
jgi:putative ABC transport system permease protein